MKKQGGSHKVSMIQCVGYLSIVSLFILSGCTVKYVTEVAAPTEQVSITPAEDSSAPTAPVETAALVIEPEVIEEKKPEPEPELGSVASVIKKMETSPYTLFWRGKNTYTYYVGGSFDAQYSPGKNLVVKAIPGDDSGVTCSYSDSGVLDKADDKMKEICGKLMFTLDGALSD